MGPKRDQNGLQSSLPQKAGAGERESGPNWLDGWLGWLGWLLGWAGWLAGWLVGFWLVGWYGKLVSIPAYQFLTYETLS